MSSWQFDHLGLVVEDLETARAFVTEAMKLTLWTEIFADPGLGVSVQFGRGDSGPCFELVMPLGEESPVRGALRASKHVLHHVAYRAADLEAEGLRLRELGCFATGEPKAALAYGGKRVQFWISPLRFLIELVEAPDHEHGFVPLSLAT